MYYVKLSIITGMRISRIPSYTPTLTDMLCELNANYHDLAIALRIDKSTAYRWVKYNNAPFSALVSVYWCTSHGYKSININAHNRTDILVNKMLYQSEYIRHLEQQLKIHCS